MPLGFHYNVPCRLKINYSSSFALSLFEPTICYLLLLLNKKGHGHQGIGLIMEVGMDNELASVLNYAYKHKAHYAINYIYKMFKIIGNVHVH